MRLLLLLLFLAVSSPALAADYYVAKTGSDANSCMTAQTHTTGKLTVAAGIVCLAAGDTLHIKAGTYLEDDLDGIDNGASALAPTTVRNYMTDVVIIRAQAGASRVLNLDGAQSNIRIFGNGADAHAGTDVFTLDCNDICGVVIDADNDGGTPANLTMEGLTIEDATDSGVYLNGGPHTFSNNQVISNGTTDFSHGLYPCAYNMLVEDNVFDDNYGYGIQQFCSGVGNGENIADNNIYQRNIFKHNGSGGILVADGEFVIVRNNLSIEDADQAGGHAGIRVSLTVGPVETYNNTIYGHGGLPCIKLEANSGGMITRNNICWNNSEGNLIHNENTTNGTDDIESNNSTSNPLFTDVDAETIAGFTPLAGSPVIDTGFDLSGDVDEDFNEDPRPVGVGYDIGAVEVGQPPDVPPRISLVCIDSEAADDTAAGTCDPLAPKKTFDAGIAILLAEGTLYARGRSTVYATDINCDDILNGVTGAYTTISQYPGDGLLPRFTPASGTNVLVCDASAQFIAFQGLRLLGTNITGDIASIDSDIRFVNVATVDGPADCLQINGDDNTITGGEVEDCGSNGIRVAGDRNVIAGGQSSASEIDIGTSIVGAGVLIEATADDTQVNFAVLTDITSNCITNLGLRSLIQGNLIVDCTIDGVDSSGNDAEIVYNTIYSNTVVGVHISGGSGALVANNALCLNMTALTDAGSGTTQTTNNSTCDANDFDDPATFQFDLDPASDLIDAGTAVVGYPDSDYIGGDRESGAAPDQGAFEFVQPTAISLEAQCAVLRVGDTFDFEWSCTSCTLDVTLSYSVNGGQQRVVSVEAFGSSPYTWTVDAPATETLVLQVQHGSGVTDDSIDYCTVYGNNLFP